MSQEASFNEIKNEEEDILDTFNTAIKKEEEDILDTFNSANNCDNNDADTI